jgi:endonuclease I
MQPKSIFNRTLILSLAMIGLGAAAAAHAQYEPPPGYYDAATGTGSLLRNQLQSIMSTGHIQRSYGDFRYAAAIIDRDPNNASRILLVYNRASVPSAWNCSGGCVWNREHVWPQSRQPGSASNSTKGNLGDPHALRPANEAINNQRGNLPFGLPGSTGSYRTIGSYWFPGDDDKGDVARALFYSATRYQGSLSLVNGIPGSNQMGDLNALLRHHHADPPDEFERRRNHAIYSSSLNPSYYTNNRNAYIDHPEFAWSALGPGANDSTLYVGATAPGDGASALTVNLGPVITGAGSVPAQSVTLNKIGADPTYYSVTASAGASSDLNGRYNAFDIDGQTRALQIGWSGATTPAGAYSGLVTIDNLDVSSGGSGQGSADGDDFITVALDVQAHAEASFDGQLDQDVLTIDLDVAPATGGVVAVDFEIHNLEDVQGLTAGLDIDAITPSGDTTALLIDAAPLADLPAGDSQGFTAYMDTAAGAGSYSATYVLAVSDADLPGAQPGTNLTLTLVGEVSGILPIYPFDDDGNGIVDQDDFAGFAACFAGPDVPVGFPCDNHDHGTDGTSDGDVDLDDFAAFMAASGN